MLYIPVSIAVLLIAGMLMYATHDPDDPDEKRRR